MARPSPQTDRLIAIVDLLASRTDEGLTLSEISRRLGLTPGTCHPMVTSLLKAGWLVRHPTRKTFRLGPALAVVGRVAEGGFTAVDVCHPVMVELQSELGLSCLALVPGPDHATVVDMVWASPVHDSTLRIGDQVPFHPPLGVAYIAWQDRKAIAKWLDRGAADAQARTRYADLLPAARRRGFSIDLAMPHGRQLRELLSRFDGPLRTGGDLASSAQLRRMLEGFAQRISTDRDYAPVDLDPDRMYGLGAMSAPVFDHNSEVVLLLALRGFTDEVSGRRAEEIGRRLAIGAETITEAIGGRRPDSGAED